MSKTISRDVVILRAPRIGDPLVGAVSALGCRVYQWPVQKITPIGADDLHVVAQLDSIDSYDTFIFVSGYAAALALRWLDRARPTLHLVGDCFAVGPTSAAPLEQRSIPVLYPPRLWTTEGLLALPALCQVTGKKILIFRGRGGLSRLGDVLVERGASVEYCELYDRAVDYQFRKEIVAMLHNGGDTVLIAHAGGVIDDLLTVSGSENAALVQNIPIVVPGERLRDYARQAGFRRVITATSAVAADMESALIGWYTPKQ
tara:strand:+ start:30593 stop:31369 length:777 start_codon:yes stop_codon:yes gene_type:complete